MSSKNVELPPPQPKKHAKKTLANSTMVKETACRKGVSSVTNTKKSNQTSRNAFDLSIRSNASVASASNVDSRDGKDFEDLTKKLAYNEYLESLFLETLVDEKIAREKTELDLKMTELATRLEFNKLVLSKTHSRLKELSFLSEQQRILDEREIVTENFNKDLEENETEEVLENLNSIEDLYCDRLHLKNVNFGYTEETSYQKLLNAILEVSDSLEKIKSECNTELDSMGPISKGFQGCVTAEESIDKNLNDCSKIIPEMSENVLEAVSNELSQVTM